MFLLSISVHNYGLKNGDFHFSLIKKIFYIINVSFSYLISLITKVASPEFRSIIHLAIKIPKKKVYTA